jgi:PTH2 family peptidyl-tRNA hydrolase
MDTKQVIIVRRDLNMRTGKIASQVAHASMAFLTKELFWRQYDSEGPEYVNNVYFGEQFEEIDHWLKNSFRKIVCYVNSEAELLEIYKRALDLGLIAHIVEDNGATEFKGVKTVTCLALGPAVSTKFEGLTDHLPLL